MKKAKGWWLIVLVVVLVNGSIFTALSIVLAGRIVKYGTSDMMMIKAWQASGWFLGPTKVGGLVKSLPEIVGCNAPKYYFVLLQNRYELRASGGLMGSYARIKFENCGLAEIKVEDIYEPDGQIVGHVEPPTPIQEAFQQGWYKLRDSNWEIDFTKSAQVISWFFEKGNEVKPDGIIAVNFDVILDLLKKIGPLYLPDFKQEITPDNFYEVVQAKVEEGFFPGSTQKRDFLTALERVFMDKIGKASMAKKVTLTRIVFDHLKRGEIMVFSENAEAQKFIENNGWDGGLRYKRYAGRLPICSDYFYSVESNLGANKANRFVERTVSLDVNKNGDKLFRKVTIVLINNSPAIGEDEDPLLFGGTYVDYHRVIIPIESEEVNVEVGGKELGEREIARRDFTDSGLSEIGFWVTVAGGEDLPAGKAGIELEIEYKTEEKTGWCLYRIDYQRQPGTGEYRVVLSYNRNTFFDKIIGSNFSELGY